VQLTLVRVREFVREPEAVEEDDGGCRVRHAGYDCRAAPGDGLRSPRANRNRILRGGSFARLGVAARSAARSAYLPSGRDHFIGLRPARELDR
jgi:formylglycine-generating enzyme required for sulfatase activity